MTEDEILTTGALRIAGYRYQEDAGLDVAKVLSEYRNSGKSRSATPLDILACLFHQQRYLCKFGGEQLPRTSCEWKVYRQLFLDSAHVDVPEKYRLKEDWGSGELWDRELKCRLTEIISIVTTNHERTKYTPPHVDSYGGRSLQLNILGDRARDAVACDYCFQSEREENWGRVPLRPHNRKNDVAQAPWIGPRYQAAIPRVAVMMLNPGHAAAPHKLKRKVLGSQLREGEITYELYSQCLTELVSEWGFGRVVKWIEAVGLDWQAITFLNVALCAVADDDYFPALFMTCFERHTRMMLSLLQPDVVLLCGKKQLAPYVAAIEALGPKTILTWHYRPMYTKTGQAELQRVRSELNLLGC